MEDAHVHVERSRKNRILALGLFGVSVLILGVMIAVVVFVRSGALTQILEIAR